MYRHEGVLTYLFRRLWRLLFGYRPLPCRMPRLYGSRDEMVHYDECGKCAHSGLDSCERERCAAHCLALCRPECTSRQALTTAQLPAPPAIRVVR